MAEFYRARLSAMLSANTDFQILISFAAAFNTDFNQFSDSFLVNALERIICKNTFFKILRQESSDIVA